MRSMPKLASITEVAISPRAKFAAALAAAVTPIMKLDVAEETLKGSRNAVVHGGNLEHAAADA